MSNLKTTKFPENISLPQILWLAALLRLLAIIFSKGYGFSDDHFEVVEVAQGILEGKKAWAEGEIYLFNLIYIYIHTWIFGFCEWIGMPDPNFKMLLTRIFHSSISMLTVFYGYKLVEKTEGKQFASIVGLLLAAFWLFPFLSVRNLREFICVPFLMAAFYYLTDKSNLKSIAIAGFCLGLAFVFRLQTVFFPVGIGMYLLLQKRFKELFVLTAATLFSLGITQFLFDYLYWGHPLASLIAYSEYNATHSQDYPNLPWWHYIGTVAGLGLPLLSFFFMVSFFWGRKKHPEIFWGALFFFVFHSAFPNKQERFILPFFPFLFILAVSGIKTLQENGNSWFTGKLFRFSVWAFVLTNGIALIVLTFTFSKKSRVETMSWFYGKREINTVLFTSGNGIPFPPMFYSGKQLSIVQMDGGRPVEDVISELKNQHSPTKYCVIVGFNKHRQVFKKLQQVFPNKKFIQQAEFQPSLVDNIAFWLNPTHNVNETWYVYKIE